MIPTSVAGEEVNARAKILFAKLQLTTDHGAVLHPTCPWKNMCHEGLPISATHISRVQTCHSDTPTKGELGLQLVGGDGGVKLVLASDGQKGVLVVEVTVNDDISPDDSVAGPGTTAAGH